MVFDDRILLFKGKRARQLQIVSSGSDDESEGLPLGNGQAVGSEQGRESSLSDERPQAPVAPAVSIPSPASAPGSTEAAPVEVPAVRRRRW